MNTLTKPRLPVPTRNRLPMEIGLAMLVKVILLIGLWLLIFRWIGKPSTQPDMAAHFALPAVSTDFNAQSTQESRHVR